MTRVMIEKQVRDLRVRLENQAAKFEMREEQLKESINVLKNGLGNMPIQIKMLQKYIHEREATIDKLQDEVAELKKENRKLTELVEKFKLIISKLTARLKKNSSTSDKPPSTDVFVKPKPQSLREKSGKKPGGQLGHKGHGPKLFENPSQIIEKKPCTCENCGCDNIEVGEEYARRQLVDLEINVNVTEERVFSGVCLKCGSAVSEEFDEEYKGPLQYGVNLRSIITLLNEYGCISDSRTAEIVNSISGSILNISWGTIVNIRKELAEKLEATINAIREALIICDVMNGDETGCRVNGKLNWIQVFCNNSYTLYGLSEKRGDFDDSMGVLAFFIGILIHDHFSSYYKYKTLTHAECNQHILRYLKGLVEIFKHDWLERMSNLLKSACHDKNELLRTGKTEMPLKDIEKFSDRYDEILKQGWEEYKAATQGDEQKEKYYNDERCLLTRLEEYKDEHILFLKDFRVPFTNNGAEKMIGLVKVKCKVSGCFRSADGASWFLRIMSLISTLRKQNMMVYDGIRSIFLGQDLFSSA